MAEDKIPVLTEVAGGELPVLTEVYKPAASEKPPSSADNATPDLVAKVTAKIKPRLESEITDFVLEELREEIKRARNDVINSTKDFVDKTKADLKTELPSMYQESLKFSQVDIDQVKKATLSETALAIRKDVTEFQNKVIIAHQKEINASLALIAKRAEDSANEQVGIMHSQVGTIQQEAFAKLRAEFAAEKAKMLKDATAEMQTAFANQIAGVEGQLIKNIEAVLNKALPSLENRVRSQLAGELQQLLLKVKFVLPE